MTHEPTTRYALAALDMDGTLLNSDHLLTPFTRNALDRAAAAGKVIALCTGRCLSELWQTFREAPGIGYAIGENGGCLYDVKAGRVLYQAIIPEDAARAALEMAGEYDLCAQCFIAGQSWLQYRGEAALAPYHVAEYVPVFDGGSKYDENVVQRALEHGRVEKINLYFADPAQKADFCRRVDGLGLNVVGSLGYGCELSPAGADKAEGLKRLCGLLGIPVADALAVGDGGNDLGLVRAAGLGVAMGNAADEVKAVADVLTDDCDHDGAARAVLRYMLGEDAQRTGCST